MVQKWCFDGLKIDNGFELRYNKNMKTKMVHFKGAAWRKVTDCGKSGVSLVITRDYRQVTCKTCLKALNAPFSY